MGGLSSVALVLVPYSATQIYTLTVESIVVPMVNINGGISNSKDKAMKVEVSTANSINSSDISVSAARSQSTPSEFGNARIVFIVNECNVALGEWISYPFQY